MLTVNSLEPARSQKNRISFPVIYLKRAASVTLEIGLGQNSKKKILVLSGTILLTVPNYWECKKVGRQLRKP